MRKNERASSASTQPLVAGASCLNALWGAWLLSNAFSLNYDSSMALWSDLICGALIIAFSMARVAGGGAWLSWATSAVGCWLLLAPLVFWTRSAAVYSNDSLLGSLVVLCGAWAASAVKGPHATAGGDDHPRDWNYNPSTWSQRLPIIGLAMLGFFLARHLAAYQLGHTPSVWEPFFGNGTERILRSDISRAFPVSDAGLGAFSYLLDALAGAIGDRNRWRNQPWIVVLFGFMVIPPGVTSITLVILQPVAVGAWCTICLITAFVMLLMVPPAIDEVVASAQFLISAKKSGKPFWKTFWKGDGSDSLESMPPAQVLREPSFLRLPWHLVLGAIIGLWLMFAPTVLGLIGLSSDNLYFVAALVVTFSVIAVAETGRPARFMNILLSAWLLVAALLLPGAPALARVLNALAALAIGLLNVQSGSFRHSYGNYDRWLRWSPFRRSLKAPRDRPGTSSRAA